MNPFKQLLKAAGSHQPLGTWIVSASAIVAEAVGHAGFDWCVVDMEHAPLEPMGVLHVLQALSATKLVPVVRVPWNDAVTIKRVLDVGATTLLVPFVESAEAARQAVAATRYAPEGMRGVSGMSRASRYGSNLNYLRTANDGMGVIVQIETPLALERLEAIAAVDGVDALFIGPADLSAAMGYPGQPGHPAVMQAMSDAVQRCEAIGKPLGTIGGSPDAVAQYRAAGFNYLAVSSDLGLLMRGAQAVLAALRTPDAEHVHLLSSGTQTPTGY
jgi:2-keto-3-deoxy-L-rhamnonate aldolase RhmA